MKRTSMFFRIALGALVVLAIAGCTNRVLDFTVISSKNVNLKLKDSGVGNRTVGEDNVWWILSIPLGTPNLKEAVDRAIEAAGPGYDALRDGVIYSKFYYFLLTAKSGFKVEGTPIKTTELITQLESEGKDPSEALAGLLYHSSVGKDNTAAIEKIGVKEIDPKESDNN